MVLLRFPVSSLHIAEFMFSGDKPRTRGEKFQDMNSQNTTHRRIDFQLSKQKQRYIHVKLDPASLKNVEENGKIFHLLPWRHVLF